MLKMVEKDRHFRIEIGLLPYFNDNQMLMLRLSVNDRGVSFFLQLQAILDFNSFITGRPTRKPVAT